MCTSVFIVFTKINVEVQNRFDRIYQGFLFTYSPFIFLCIYLKFRKPKTRFILYMYSVYGIPTLITYQTHNLCIYVYIHIYIKPIRTTLLWISTSQISGVPVHSLKTSMTCTRLYLSKG